MKKTILNIGTALTKKEQKEVSGGLGFADDCTIPSNNPCDPMAGQSLGNPACNLGEVCVLYYNGTYNLYGRCECPE
jgi:hypothetical protein